jgi:mannose-1-phosphate guanylyltransferase/mannose-6-phosphate isomerase
LTDRPPLYAVVLAGGSGTRLWPLARRDRPKPFLPVVGGDSLYARALRRLGRLVPESRRLVVAAAAHERWVRAQAGRLPAGNLILEGEGRDTAASVALAALEIERRSPGAVMAVLPSDHDIRPPGSFRRALRRAAAEAARHDALVTFGIRPHGPRGGFGYIVPGRAARGEARPVVRFVEKPEAAAARRLLRRGALWNSGLFVWRASTILEALGRHRPDILAGARRAAARRRGRGSRPWRIPSAAMRRIPRAPIDRAVLERSTRVRVLDAPFSWNDRGTWDAIGDNLPADRNGNRHRGRVLSVGARRCLVWSEDMLVALVGVEDLVVVQSRGAVLVCRAGAAQAVREAAARLAGPLERFR